MYYPNFFKNLEKRKLNKNLDYYMIACFLGKASSINHHSTSNFPSNPVSELPPTQILNLPASIK